MFSYLYIITDGQNNFKIGITKNEPEKRLKQLQTGHPKKLSIVSIFKLPREEIFKLEKQAHRVLQSKYLKRGEWFEGNQWHIHLLVDEVCHNYLL